MLKLVQKYRNEAEICLNSKAYFAGLVSTRAALETILMARFLLELFDWSEKDLKKYNITITDDNEIYLSRIPNLKTLIDETYKAKLITKTGYNAAHRIREWGNKIHSVKVTNMKRLPNISSRNLNARLKDLDLVIDQLLKTI
ncbi:hypothetical protein [Thermodesulfatator autotrophicus]|uniref:DUF4145 domain-containing protein n=1 Tax=Thermodesulfatator autotrophicus TaxID=1795632 RepID=A0A177E9B3_9BACT|nr:hypothetical protein [Thermodesulfatator autotrophicus]OAG28296.1 hypothetical protein TH606_02210 [Thermodesulfatator autotrophicus]